jgi:hypothetical protein
MRHENRLSVPVANGDLATMNDTVVLLSSE